MFNCSTQNILYFIFDVFLFQRPSIYSLYIPVRSNFEETTAYEYKFSILKASYQKNIKNISHLIK